LKRKHVLLLAAGLVVVLTVISVVVMRSRVQRRRVFRPAAGETKPVAPKGIPPVEQWTSVFQQLSGEELQELLEAIETRHPDLYRKYSLAYLHARVLVENDETSEAASRLAPFLEKGNPYRELALYHRASIADGAEASRYRRLLIEEHPQSPYRDEAIDEEIGYLADNPKALVDFAAKIAPSASTERRREMSARVVEAVGDVARGMALLNGGTGDDAADRVVRALDKPAVIAKLNDQQRVLMAEALHKHRHYDRAAALLSMVLKKAYTDELQFALGRSYFGAEKYAEAQAAYLRGAKATKKPDEQCQFLWHAARAAQLRGDDKTAEQLMTAAIAVKGKFPATTVALTQRMRTRLKQKRFKEAAADLALLRKLAPNERAVLEGLLAYAVAMLAAGHNTAAVSALNSVPVALRNDHDDAELAYWRGRALESRNPADAVRAYLEVLRSDSHSHFDVFARKRLAAMGIDHELKMREGQVANLIAGKQWDLARRIQTDRVLLREEPAQLAKLASIYRQIPAYREVLELAPDPLPRFPTNDTDRDTLLMAMGLHDEAVGAIQRRWGLRPQREGLTRALALNLGAASRESIYAIEVLMKNVPDDFHPALLPQVVRRLLYPRYFYSFIAEDAKRYEADPALVLSIMREESRFNPRAKSQAAARGLLQFIITTARDIGRDVGLLDVDPEDLYDPRVIIRLGAKYISELGEQFDGNHYRIAAAYNAGPKQVAQWERLQPAPGDDYFLTAIHFDETKDYVRKVMNSYERYVEIYGGGAPAGGLRAEP
jgi:tetratricopeptide (TPR) repeat protein